ncbi:MAG: DivIVA domain-containing protein [Erysipelotrichaceae bacterium]|nr:DivIVA domain-containing protein [Erysipelotrichaceae bacterium]
MEKLNLTPDEILEKQFQVDFKGYSASEVDSFLDQVLEDYQKMEDNVQELLDHIAELEAQIKMLNNENIELQGKQKAFDLSNTTSYSSVDLLKRLSRLEEMVYSKK